MWREELSSACVLLTRLPVRGGAVPLADCVWAFPPVGALVGGIGAVVLLACHWGGLPAPVAAVWALAATVLVTGGLHEDGLADTADGFGGGRTTEKRLEIMRDSRIGGFGALALLLAMAARGTALATMATPWRAAGALVASGALGRAAILLLLLWLAPARPDGLAATLRESTFARCHAGLALAVLVALALLPFGGAVRAVLGAGAASVALAALARRQIGGYTGDVLGAASVLAECVALSMLSG